MSTAITGHWELIAIGGIGTWEMFAILVVALLLFGSRLPSVMRSVGQSWRELRKGLNGVTDELEAPAEKAGDEDSGRSSYPSE